MKEDVFKIYSISLCCAGLIYCNNISAQFNHNYSGSYTLQSTYLGNTTAQLDTSTCSCEGNTFTVFLNGDITPYAYCTADTTNGNVGYHPAARAWYPPPSYQEKSKGTVSLGFDTITAIYWIQENNGSATIVSGPFTDMYIRRPTGINTIENKIGAKSWPNPVIQNLYYTIKCDAPEVIVRVVDMTGKCMYQSSVNASDFNTIQSINMQTYLSGMYVLQIVSGDYLENKKIIKE